jgi:hypothetical protein
MSLSYVHSLRNSYKLFGLDKGSTIEHKNERSRYSDWRMVCEEGASWMQVASLSVLKPRYEPYGPT